MASQVLPPKRDVMLALLERSSVFIHVDPRGEAVRVPAWFKKQPQLVLQVGLNMAVRITDLSVEDDAVSCTLSFSRSPFFCYLPWGSVFALFGEDGKGMLWPSDVPREVAAQQAELARKEQARTQLRSVDGPPPAGGPAPAPLEAPRVLKPVLKPAPVAAVPLPLPVVPQSATARAGSVGTEAASGAGKGASPDGAPRKEKGGKKTRKRRPAAGPRAAEPSSAPAEPTPQAVAGRDSKRKLPPYLRIVK